MLWSLFLASLVVTVLPVLAENITTCPGYKAINIKQHESSLEADLVLAGDSCDLFSPDLSHLKLLAEYQTENRLHVIIYDADEQVYQVPESVLPRPVGTGKHGNSPNIQFSYEPEPFSFKVLRNDEILFDTSETTLVFETQYLKLRTWLPESPNIYGLGEHSDSLRLPNINYTRTIWSRDAYGIPSDTNLYGTHPVYVDHRGSAGTHGVFFLNSNGMDIKVDKSDDDRQYLEFNTQGGVLDLYFLAGPTPKDVSKQYAEVVGLPAMQGYWGFGFHQCRYGYQDVFEVAEVVYNYSRARIPLETMWTDIDYMHRRRTFTLDSERYPIESMRELVDHLHEKDQHYIVMVDPAISTIDNNAFNQGNELGVFLTDDSGDLYEGAVWPGVTVWPDWFNPRAQGYWNDQFARFFNSQSGVDIDGLWIDMNEAANFCPDPCDNPASYAREADLPPAPPPVRSPPRTIPWFPTSNESSDSPSTGRVDIQRRDSGRKGEKIGIPGRDLLNPQYEIANAAGSLSNKTIRTDIVHAGEGYVEYDTHNLYGTMMSTASREAMLRRRPEVRPLVITRSTFAGAGAHVGHWLGDNVSSWDKYRVSIAQMLAFASIFQIPMVGSDVCGFGGNTTEELCARWATLGAFYPFYRNHNEFGSIPQEFYRWPVVAEAARKSIDTRYRLLDYLYTAFWRQTQTGEPFLQPLFYLYPNDSNTFGNELQFFYGDALLISPVQEQGQTSVSAYLPDDVFYDFYTHKAVRGHGQNVTLDDIPLTDIPVHIRGGAVIPLRVGSAGSRAQTTAELRRKNFELLVAPGLDGRAQGQLYLDDGESLVQNRTSRVTFDYAEGTLRIRGEFGYDPSVVVESITVLGRGQDERRRSDSHSADRQTFTTRTRIELTGATEIQL